jgi:hypothetical protein
VGGVRWLLAAALAVLGLAACATADRPEPPGVAPTTTAAGPDGIADRTLAWEAGRLDADPRRVVVSFTGAAPAADPADPCWQGYAPEVSAEPGRVVVRVRAYRSRTPLGAQQACTDLGFVRTLAVPLHNSLASRAVLDGHDGRRHRLAPVPLEPRWLPDGWRLVQELGQAGPGGRDTWERSYGPGPAVERSDADQAMAVRWREGRRGLAVSAAFPTTPSDRDVAALQALLVRVARSLR